MISVYSRRDRGASLWEETHSIKRLRVEMDPWGSRPVKHNVAHSNSVALAMTPWVNTLPQKKWNVDHSSWEHSYLRDRRTADTRQAVWRVKILRRGCSIATYKATDKETPKKRAAAVSLCVECTDWLNTPRETLTWLAWPKCSLLFEQFGGLVLTHLLPRLS